MDELAGFHAAYSSLWSGDGEEEFATVRQRWQRLHCSIQLSSFLTAAGSEGVP